MTAPAGDGRALVDFYDAPYSPTNLDVRHGRRAVFHALQRSLPTFRGVLLDVGCGDQPYRPVVMDSAGAVKRYIGVDLPPTGRYGAADVWWDGLRLPFRSGTVDTLLLTEVLEHCPDPQTVLAEVYRVAAPEATLFVTVPFLWPLHDVPYDEYRYTPFSLERMLVDAGFHAVDVRALGGWDASLATMLGLWARRRPMSARRRAVLSRLLLPVIRRLAAADRPPTDFGSSTMLTALTATATKPGSRTAAT